MTEVFLKTTRRNQPPFRHDIVGSFLRPRLLKEARARFVQGAISADDLAEIENIAIRDLVKKQKAAGLKAVTDGEFRRSWWHLDFMWGLDGVEKAAVDRGYQFHGLATRAETARLTGKIAFGDHPFLDHYRFLQEIAGLGVLARQTIPAPAQFLAELQRAENRDATSRIYSDSDTLLADITTAYRAAIAAFYDLGCRNLQLDDCTWGMLCDQGYREASRKAGLDVEAVAALYAEINNAALAGHPDDLVLTTHVCRGNYRSTWASSGGYEPVAEVLFGQEQVAAYYLEFDTDRAGGFAPLRHVGDKQVVLGLVSSKIGELEDKDDLVRRVEEATQYVPLDQLCLSPQCGFASTEEGNALSEEQQWAKLRLVKEVADAVWA